MLVISRKAQFLSVDNQASPSLSAKDSVKTEYRAVSNQHRQMQSQIIKAPLC